MKFNGTPQDTAALAHDIAALVNQFPDYEDDVNGGDLVDAVNEIWPRLCAVRDWHESTAREPTKRAPKSIEEASANPAPLLLLPMSQVGSSEGVTLPHAAVVEWDSALRDRIPYLANLCETTGVAEIREFWNFGTPDHLDIEMPEDADDFLVIDGESPMRSIVVEADPMQGIRAEMLVVTDDAWYLSCYDKYTEVAIETAERKIDFDPLVDAEQDAAVNATPPKGPGR